MNSQQTELLKKSSSSRFMGMGKILDWERTPFGFKGRTENGFFQLSVFDQSIIRVQASLLDEFTPNPYSVVMEPNKVPFEVSESDDFLILTTSEIQAKVDSKKFAVSFFDKTGNLLNQDDSLGISWIGTEVSCYKKVQEDEKFIGLGEKT
ncbi:DUF4968 domain-containing protein, partial [uncultured Algoriphagus sp.]